MTDSYDDAATQRPSGFMGWLDRTDRPLYRQAHLIDNLLPAFLLVWILAFSLLFYGSAFERLGNHCPSVEMCEELRTNGHCACEPGFRTWGGGPANCFLQGLQREPMRSSEDECSSLKALACAYPVAFGFYVRSGFRGMAYAETPEVCSNIEVESRTAAVRRLIASYRKESVNPLGVSGGFSEDFAPNLEGWTFEDAVYERSGVPIVRLPDAEITPRTGRKERQFLDSLSGYPPVDEHTIAIAGSAAITHALSVDENATTFKDYVRMSHTLSTESGYTTLRNSCQINALYARLRRIPSLLPGFAQLLHLVCTAPEFFYDTSVAVEGSTQSTREFAVAPESGYGPGVVPHLPFSPAGAEVSRLESALVLSVCFTSGAFLLVLLDLSVFRPCFSHPLSGCHPASGVAFTVSIVVYLSVAVLLLCSVLLAFVSGGHFSLFPLSNIEFPHTMFPPKCDAGHTYGWRPTMNPPDPNDIALYFVLAQSIAAGVAVTLGGLQKYLDDSIRTRLEDYAQSYSESSIGKEVDVQSAEAHFHRGTYKDDYLDDLPPLIPAKKTGPDM